MDNKTLALEKEKLKQTVRVVTEAKVNLEEQLKDIGEENLEKLKDLRETPETDGLDFFMYLEQLHQKNITFNLKDKFLRLEELEYLKKDPYFARIDLQQVEGDHIRKVYIGKFGYSENEPIVTDWRAKIASVYYRYRYPQKNVKYTTPEGEVVSDLLLKRTYEIDSGDLVRYYNNDLQLDEAEIISDKIAKRTGGVLEDIIETIQGSQLDIIEADPRKFCVVQGCVGSGKSTVAIHKLSHIFFNYPQVIRPQNSLLVAKSHILIGYLSTLFPKLGIFNLNYKTLKELMINIIFREEIDQQYDLSEEALNIFTVEESAKLEKQVMSVHKKIEQKIEQLFLNEDFESFRSYKYSYKVTPYENISEIISDLDDELVMQKEQLKENPKSLRAELHKDNIRTLKKLITSLKKIRIDLKNRDFEKVLRTSGINRKNKLNYQQMLVLLFYYLEIVGLQKLKKYEYCVVDEAQDFSLLELMVLRNLVLFRRICVFGDLNQGYSHEGISDWEDINKILLNENKFEFFTLDTNYRSTKPIIELANKILSPYTQYFLPRSIERIGKGPVLSQFETAEMMLDHLKQNLEDDVKDLNKSIGLICFSVSSFDEAKNMVRKLGLDKNMVVELKENKRINYIPKGIYLTMFEDCKGLEFSKVYILDLDLDKVQDEKQAKKAFIAVTRAMNELQVYCVK